MKRCILECVWFLTIDEISTELLVKIPDGQ